MQNLEFLIDQVQKGRHIHISICDLNGILYTPLTRIDNEKAIHSQNFCNIAKSTPKGMNSCLKCKMLANRKAIVTKQPFCGYCIYGICEAGYPVVIDDVVSAIVYVGNAIVDENKSKKLIKMTCDHTGVDKNLLYNEFVKCEYIDDIDELLRIAELISDYIKLLYSAAPQNHTKLHWLVALLKQYADENYCSDLSLGNFVRIYDKNEKYAGKLFKEQIGKSFCEYYTHLRIKRAELFIKNSNSKIIDIAYECGFNNISYFNRIFQEKHGISPSEFRKRNLAINDKSKSSQDNNPH